MVVSDEVFLLWQNWLQSVYLPIVKTSGTIEKVRVFKLLDAPEKHYAVHCETSSPAQLMHFIENTIPQLLQQLPKLLERKFFFGELNSKK